MKYYLSIGILFVLIAACGQNQSEKSTFEMAGVQEEGKCGTAANGYVRRTAKGAGTSGGNPGGDQKENHQKRTDGIESGRTGQDKIPC